MRVLLSIKPEFVEKIFDGTKKYEFRKSLFRRNDIKCVIIYASAPIKQVVGEFEIDEILSDKVDMGNYKELFWNFRSFLHVIF